MDIGGRMARLTDKEYFCERSSKVGYMAFQYERFFNAVEGYVKMQHELDDIYGDLEIVNLVDKDMAERFKQAIYKFRLCIEMASDGNAEKEEVIKRAEICKRGLLAMRKYVEENNIVDKPEIFIYEQDGKKIFGIIKNVDDLRMAKRLYKDIEAIYSLDEIYLMLTDYKSVHQLKSELNKNGHNPIIKDIKNKEVTEEYFNDDIPF
tara:strand:- start:1084 stop:1701 length:618 start_codon:yes stop_codon:yes gene_type:complete